MNRIMRKNKGIVRWFYVNMGLIVIMAAFLGEQVAAAEWEQLADMPTARWALSVSVVDGKVYAIGGSSSGWPGWVIFPTVEVYDPVMNKWTEKAEMLTARAWFSTSVVDGKIYVIGGWPGNGPITTSVEEYNPKTDTWTLKAPLPDPRIQISSQTVNGKIYVIGGGDKASNGTPSTFEYDPLEDTWARKADMPALRVGLGTSVVNGKIYAIGGKATELGFGAFPSVYEYDPLADTWTKKADMLTPRVHFATAEVNGKIYCIGGGSVAGTNVTVEIYDPKTDTWAKGENLPSTRAYIWADSWDGKIYVIGGIPAWPPVASSKVEVFDTGLRDTSRQAVSVQGKLAKTWGELKQRD